MIQFTRGVGGEVNVRVSGAAPVEMDRATLVGRSIQVAKGRFAKDDGAVVGAGANASAVRLAATGEAAILVQNTAPDGHVSVRLPSSGAQLLCAPQDLQGRVGIAAQDWVSNEVVTRLTALMNQDEAARVDVGGLVQVIGQAKAQRAVITLQQLGVHSSMGGPGLARALTELTLCLAGIVGEVGRASQVIDGATDSSRADGACLGDEAFRIQKFSEFVLQSNVAGFSQFVYEFSCPRRRQHCRRSGQQLLAPCDILTQRAFKQSCTIYSHISLYLSLALSLCLSLPLSLLHFLRFHHECRSNQWLWTAQRSEPCLSRELSTERRVSALNCPDPRRAMRASPGLYTDGP